MIQSDKRNQDLNARTTINASKAAKEASKGPVATSERSSSEKSATSLLASPRTNNTFPVVSEIVYLSAELLLGLVGVAAFLGCRDVSILILHAILVMVRTRSSKNAICASQENS